MNITVTRSMIEEIAHSMLYDMRNANMWRRNKYAEGMHEAEAGILSAERTLTALQIPVRTFRTKPDKYYTAVEIGDVTFSVGEEEEE